jgi:hypothetical protein
MNECPRAYAPARQFHDWRANAMLRDATPD